MARPMGPAMGELSIIDHTMGGAFCCVSHTVQPTGSTTGYPMAC